MTEPREDEAPDFSVPCDRCGADLANGDRAYGLSTGSISQDIGGFCADSDEPWASVICEGCREYERGLDGRLEKYGSVHDILSGLIEDEKIKSLVAPRTYRTMVKLLALLTDDPYTGRGGKLSKGEEEG